MAAKVRASFESYVTEDRARIEALLHPDFTFTSPYDDHIDRATYFERCWLNAGTFEKLDLIEVQPAGAGCFVFYEGRSRAGNAFRNTEYFTFEDGRIRSVEVFFGLAPGTTPAKPEQRRG
ncbi:DUF4440 domain-containing protein [Sphingomonas cavernae]|uniref:DUF4440 domain-containing protein n=2 Tax=Sphingomonas cavernae TaxID=2320861 RepID=A0A418WNB2_9SPHN|nr:DUF4440 domain-containing protein [Sphingomonas cavernae]